jgi:hypothetical protein
MVQKVENIYINEISITDILLRFNKKLPKITPKYTLKNKINEHFKASKWMQHTPRKRTVAICTKLSN